MRLALLVVCCVLCSADPLSSEWIKFTNYVHEHKKPYRNDSSQLIVKFNAFKQSLIRHQKLNEIESQLNGTAVYGINKFSDLTQEEFRSMYLGAPWKPNKLMDTASNFPFAEKDIPLKFDWRNWKNTNTVTSVNDQKYCGSCWAFSAVETIETAVSIQTQSKPVKLSAQQLISCEYSSTDSLIGCKGGDPIRAFTYIKDKTIVVSDEMYPFSSSDGETGNCKSNLPAKGVMLEEFINLQNVNESGKMTALISQVSPTSNAVNAVMWQDYQSGVIQHHCDQSVLDHAIQVVGYSLENDPVPYWIVRNSWGSDWGEDGYVRLSLGSNTCGIAAEAGAVSKVKIYT